MNNLIQYPYLILCIYFSCIWLILFLRSGQNKGEMIKASIIGAILGPAVQYMHLLDWWKPRLIYPGILNLEDIVFGFTVAGVVAVFYEIILHKKERKYKKLVLSLPYEILTLLSGLLILFVPFILFRVHSFITSILAGLIVVILILMKRRDLLVPMLLSGLLMIIISVPIYLLILYFYPTVFIDQWIVSNLSGIAILNIPIEELAWYGIVGASFSCIYEFIFGFRYSNNNNVATRNKFHN